MHRRWVVLRLADQPQTIALHGLCRGRDRERQAFSEGEVPTHSGSLSLRRQSPSPADRGSYDAQCMGRQTRPMIGFASRL
ncbi:MAG: hypothetical protein MJE68_25365 [Proteobacteria bacterium]|nr:hypothetical protein [Pseudomonadota bacterium]